MIKGISDGAGKVRMKNTRKGGRGDLEHLVKDLEKKGKHLGISF